MFNAPSAPSGLTDGAEYLGCTDAREKRRACHDDLCQVRANCLLWTDRDQPGHMTRCMTWRRHYECHSLPCDFFKPTTPR